MSSLYYTQGTRNAASLLSEDQSKLPLPIVLTIIGAKVKAGEITLGQLRRYRGCGKNWIRAFCVAFGLQGIQEDYERVCLPPHQWIFAQRELDYSI